MSSIPPDLLTATFQEVFRTATGTKYVRLNTWTYDSRVSILLEVTTNQKNNLNKKQNFGFVNLGMVLILVKLSVLDQ